MAQDREKDSRQFRRPASYRRDQWNAEQAARTREQVQTARREEVRRTREQAEAQLGGPARQAAEGQTVHRQPPTKAPDPRRARPANGQQARPIRRPPQQARPRPMPAPAPRGHVDAPGGFVPDYRFPQARQRGASALPTVLLVVSLVLRVAAIALAVLVVANCFTLSDRVDVVSVTARVSAFVPDPFSTMPIVDTPFGGTFRGDLALMSVILFVLDWICSRARYRARF